jgi:hypothetical protein
MTKYFFLSLLVVFTHFPMAYAASVVSSVSTRNFVYRIEPIIGLEQVYRSTPTAHTVNRTVYGVRGAVGTDRLSGEIEFITGQDTENFSTAPQKITNKDDKLKLGLSSSYNLTNTFFATARLGGEAAKNIRETTTNGALTSVENTDYAPYVGASIGVRLGRFVNISAGSTVVLRDLGDLAKNDYQNTLTISLGTSL